MRIPVVVALFLIAVSWLGLAAPAAADVAWSGPGWYILGFPDNLLAGPFASEAACDSEKANWSGPTPPMCLEFDHDPGS